MECNLNITSYNCNGFKNRNYEYVNEIFKKCNILMLQETWLYNFQHKNFSKIIPNCQYYAVSAMDEANVSRMGRPYGGVAILWKKGLKLTFIPIVTNSLRLCAVNVKTNSFNTILINVYKPVDDNSEVSFNEYGDILSEISAILATHNDCNIIIGGDFNVDPRRIISRNLTLLKDFLSIESLTCVTFDIVDNNYTRKGSNDETSFIDHFIISKNFECSVDVTNEFNNNITIEGVNLSDHCPVNLYTEFQSHITKNKNVINHFNDWNNATDDKILNYKQQLNCKFGNFVIPQNILDCNNFQCTEHYDTIQELSEYFMDILIICGDNAIGFKKSTQKHGIPG